MPVTVSIVMPCHNCAGRVAESIGSVLAQTFADFELLVVDNASTDQSRAVVAQQRDERIHLLTESNKGVSHARNRGLAAAQGEFVAFLDADDTWEPTFLDKMVAALRATPQAALAYCGWQNRGLPGGRGLPFVPPDYETPNKWELLVGGCRWPIHGALTRRAAIQAAGGFDPHLKIGEDFLLWMEVACFHPVIRVAEVLAYYHHHGGVQATKNMVLSALDPFRAQQWFLARHPEVARSLGRCKVRRLLYGELLTKGYELYWKRELEGARTLFRNVMKGGYGSARDWIYMLPSLLPLRLHRVLIHALERGAVPPAGAVD